MAVPKKEALLYASTSANLYNFLGMTDAEDHWSIYQETLKNNIQAHEDILNVKSSMLRIIDENGIMNSITKQPYIFVSFETGSFNSFTTMMLQQGCDVNVMADTLSLQVGNYLESADLLRERNQNNSKLDLINVEEQGAIFKLIRKIKQNQILLAFIDGNKGIGGQVKNNKNLLETHFLNGRVKIRKGIPFISFLTKAPLVLVLNYFEGDQRIIKFYDPIQVDETDREEYCAKAIGQIFSYFEEHVKTYTGQWSNWPHIHSWSVIEHFESQRSSDKVTSRDAFSGHAWDFNSERFCPLKIEDNYFLFDRLKYNLSPINADLAPLFSHKTQEAQRKNLIVELIENSHVDAENLISKKILV